MTDQEISKTGAPLTFLCRLSIDSYQRKSLEFPARKRECPGRGRGQFGGDSEYSTSGLFKWSGFMREGDLVEGKKTRLVNNLY